MTAEFHYRLPGKPGGYSPGIHGSRSRGSGHDFAAHGRLFDYPDPRRLDLRASLASVPREWQVRVNRQCSSVTLQAIVDVSASMHFGQSPGKFEVAGQFVEALGYSAFRVGDRVGLSSFDYEACEHPFQPPRTGRGLGAQLASCLAHIPAGQARAGSGQGLLECAARLRGAEALVFILSDFHWPLSLLPAVFECLGHAVVVPVVLQDPAERQAPRGRGWLRLCDAETGVRRSVWLTETSRRLWQERLRERDAELQAAFAAADLQPLFISGAFDADRVTQYFLERAA